MAEKTSAASVRSRRSSTSASAGRRAHVGALRGRRQRSAQEDDAEIGVLTDRRESRIDSGADADSDPRPPCRDRSGARLSAANEVLDLHAVAGREPMHVAWFGRVQLREARVDIGGRHWIFEALM